MAKEWVKDAQNKARVETNLHAETSKALGTAEQKNQELTTKLTAEERGRKSAKVGLKNAQDQAREQCKKLHYAEILVKCYLIKQVRQVKRVLYVQH